MNSFKFADGLTVGEPRLIEPEDCGPRYVGCPMWAPNGDWAWSFAAPADIPEMLEQLIKKGHGVAPLLGWLYDSGPLGESIVKELSGLYEPTVLFMGWNPEAESMAKAAGLKLTVVHYGGGCPDTLLIEGDAKEIRAIKARTSMANPVEHGVLRLPRWEG